MEINEAIVQEFNDRLSTEEKVIWTGRPPQGIKFKWTDIMLIPFTFIWGGMSIGITVFLLIKAPFLSIITLPFAFIGLHIMFGRFLKDKKRRSHIFYCLSKEKIYIKNGIEPWQTISLNIKLLEKIKLIEYEDKSGSIIFGSRDDYPTLLYDPIDKHFIDKEEFGEAWRGTGMSGADKLLPPAIEDIPNVRKVYQEIMLIKKAG